ncbi:hypothetical protein BASA81_011314 [Batrachochytrium salamandrivorans]|nr:hypothetical protein BASA81_011314 [Batrachochytrium salamandrivorans]
MTIVLLVPETLASLRARKRLELEFGSQRELTLPEVRELMDKYPKHTFRLDPIKVWETQHNCSTDTFTCEELALAMKRHRSSFACMSLQFLSDWLSFFASLMVFSSSTTTVLSVVQGFTICLVVADNLTINSTSNEYVGGVPIENAPGFWTGWTLTFLVFATALHLAITYAVFAACGCASYLNRRTEVEEFALAVGKFYKGTEGTSRVRSPK